MIIDGIPVNGPIEHSYLFSCSRGLRRDIRYAKEFYCREHNKYCYHVCPICLKYVCRSCMRQTCHNHDILSIQQGINRFLNATLGNLANFVACAAHKQELTLSFDLTKRAIQSVTDRLINAALEENARLLLELDQLKQHILDKNPTSDELAIPDIKGLSSRSNMNEKDMREGLRPEEVKAILTLTIGENTIAADCVHFKQNTEFTGRIGCLVINGRKSDQVRYWYLRCCRPHCACRPGPRRKMRHVRPTYSNRFP